jgi:hypothetical protein
MTINQINPKTTFAQHPTAETCPECGRFNGQHTVDCPIGTVLFNDLCPGCHRDEDHDPDECPGNGDNYAEASADHAAISTDGLTSR